MQTAKTTIAHDQNLIASSGLLNNGVDQIVELFAHAGS
jgi:hypothetical protein